MDTEPRKDCIGLYNWTGSLGLLSVPRDPGSSVFDIHLVYISVALCRDIMSFKHTVSRQIDCRKCVWGDWEKMHRHHSGGKKATMERKTFARWQNEETAKFHSGLIESLFCEMGTALRPSQSSGNRETWETVAACSSGLWSVSAVQFHTSSTTSRRPLFTRIARFLPIDKTHVVCFARLQIANDPTSYQVHFRRYHLQTTEYPRRRNVTTSMVGLKNGHIGKNLTQNGESQRCSWGTQKKKKVNPRAGEERGWRRKITLNPLWAHVAGERR